MTAAADRSDLVVVFAGGEASPLGATDDLPRDATVVAADSGADHARALGWSVGLVVGDFDSISAAELAHLEAGPATVERHAVAKDQTDLELALDRAVELAPRRIVVVGGHGGRFDHWLANTLLLTAEKYRSAIIEARFGAATVHVVWDRIELAGAPGELVTLLALRTPVTGITTWGLRYPLHDETLHPASSRGVSNELEDAPAGVTVGQGPLVVVRPGPG